MSNFRAILTLNAGSSSLKFAVFLLGKEGGGLDLFHRGQVAGIGGSPSQPPLVKGGDTPANAEPKTIGTPSPSPGKGRAGEGASSTTHADAIQQVLTQLQTILNGIELMGVGHRVVHGGQHFTQPCRVDETVLNQLSSLIPLAPQHQPHNLAAIHAVAAHAPHLTQVACFDTAFHATQSPLSKRLPFPQALVDQGLQRYGFHGLSYQYVSQTLPGVLGHMPARTLMAHLGNGASVCALQNGISVATSMGFSTLDGLLMGTRCGTLDPGVILHLLRNGMDAAALTRLLYEQSGLLGVSGISADMQVLLASDHSDAQTAVELFCYTLTRTIGSHVAALEGMDALVFTGGIGEHAARIRQQVCARLGWLGVELDEAANAQHARCISTDTSRVQVLVIPTNEELVIARHTLALLEEKPA